MPDSARFVDQFDVILFDLMDTLMLGGNRFSATQNYAETYHQLGGTLHSPTVVQGLIVGLHQTMNAHYEDPAWYENFRPASTYLAHLLTRQGLPHTDAARLHDVFAHHELGHIPTAFCHTLRQLATTHRLGLVSNLWSEKAHFEAVFHQNQIHHLFDTLVFSSDYAIIKPSPKLFRRALAAFGVPPHRVLFVGDSPDRDMAGAAALGLGTLLVNAGKPTPAYPGPQVRDVCALLDA